MALIGRGVHAEFWNRTSVTDLFGRQTTDCTVLCSSTVISCFTIDDVPGAVVCCVGASSTSCQASCPAPYQACSRSCCLNGCSGREPFAECASSSSTTTAARTTSSPAPPPSSTTTPPPPPSSSSTEAPSSSSPPPPPTTTTTSPSGSSSTTPRPSSTQASPSSTRASSSSTQSSSSSSPSSASRSATSAASSTNSATRETLSSTSSSASRTLASLPTESGVNDGSGSGGGLSQSAKIAIGVTIPDLVLIIGVLAFYLLRYRRKMKYQGPDRPELEGRGVLPPYSTSGTHELTGNNTQLVHEIGGVGGGNHAYVASAVTKDATTDSAVEKLQEPPSDQTAANLSGPPKFELPDSELRDVYVPLAAPGPPSPPTAHDINRSEMSATPIGGPTTVAAQRPDASPRELSSSPVSGAAIVHRTSGGRIIPRKELPASSSPPPSEPSDYHNTPQSPVGAHRGAALAEEEQGVQEREGLERRRAEIAAEREQLRRMQELDMEDREIQRRLSELGGPR